METAASRGLPSFVWRAGQERRFDMVRRWASLQGAVVLDVGCGVGMYTVALRRDTPHVFGIEIEFERVVVAHQRVTTVVQSPGERLPFPNDTFDLVFSNEVL